MKTLLHICLLITYILLPIHAQQAPIPPINTTHSLEKPGIIRLKQDKNTQLLLATCSVNGVKCQMIVDTAASHTTFHSGFIDKHFPTIKRIKAPIAPGSNVKTVPDIFPLNEVNIGNFHIKNCLGLCLDLSPLISQFTDTPVVGILGMNYMGLRPFRLSATNKTLEFLTEKNYPKRGLHELHSSLRRTQVFTIHCQREGNKFPLLLDSGSSLSFAPKAHWPIDETARPIVTQTTDINGKEADSIIMKRGIISNLKLGENYTLHNAQFIVDSSHPTGKRNQIGVDTLSKGVDVLLDVPNKKVYAMKAEKYDSTPKKK